MKVKVAELKGVRNLIRIECSCGAVWKRLNYKTFDNRERRRFIKEHAEHDLHSYQVTSKVS